MRNLFTRVIASAKKTSEIEVTENIFTCLAQTATDAIIIADINSTIIFCNNKATETFGYSQQEMLHTKLSLLMPARYREVYHKEIQRFVSTGSGRLIGHTLEVEGLKKNGVIFPIELSLSCWQQHGTFFTCIIRDITQRKHTEQVIIQKNKQLQQANEELVRTKEALQETNNELERRVKERTAALSASEKQLRLITNALPVLISYVDTEERYRFTNQAYEWWFNLDREAILGKTMREIAGEEAYRAVKEKIGQALAGQRVAFEALMNYQQVEPRYVAFNFIPHWEEKNVIGFFLLASDITKRRKAEEDARQASERFRLLLESIPHLTWTSSPEEFTINFFNKRWYEYTGLNQVQSLGLGWQQVLHPDDLSLAIERRTVGRREGKPYALENRYRHRDGSYRWHLARIIPIIDEKGNITLWVGTATDIHDQKMLEQTLHSTTQELAASNAELKFVTDEIQASNQELLAANQAVLESNQKLEQANQELEASNRQLMSINTDLDNFIYSASHDLKAPIANIEGLMNALVRQLPEEHLKAGAVGKTITYILESVERFKKTITHLTEVTKLQKQAQQEATVVNVYQVIEEVKLDLNPVILKAQAIIELDIAPMHTIQFSEKNLRSIIYNLLSNAIKYRLPTRTPMISIRFKEEKEYQALIVEDNGLGMDLSKENKIFSMFQRLHDHVEGSGIGLYIVKKIVDNAGGKIKVESKVGEGSTFTIYFKR